MKNYSKPTIKINYFEAKDVITTSGLTSCPDNLSFCKNTNLLSEIFNDDNRPNIIYFHGCFLDQDGDGVVNNSTYDVYYPISEYYKWEKVGHSDEHDQDIYKGTKIK